MEKTFSWYWKREFRIGEKRNVRLLERGAEVYWERKGEREGLNGRKKEVPRKSVKARESSEIYWRIVCNVRQGKNKKKLVHITSDCNMKPPAIWNFINTFKYLKNLILHFIGKKKQWIHWEWFFLHPPNTWGNVETATEKSGIGQSIKNHSPVQLTRRRSSGVLFWQEYLHGDLDKLLKAEWETLEDRVLRAPYTCGFTYRNLNGYPPQWS